MRGMLRHITLGVVHQERAMRGNEVKCSIMIWYLRTNDRHIRS